MRRPLRSHCAGAARDVQSFSAELGTMILMIGARTSLAQQDAVAAMMMAAADFKGTSVAVASIS
eukprot:550060-Amphidinium_carterae.1